jgi:hypothetical protein
MDITIGVAQEDLTQAPIYALSLSPARISLQIDIGIRSGYNSYITIQISPDTSSEISLRITLPIRSSPVEEWFDIEAYRLESQHQHQIEPELHSELDPEQATTLVVQLGDAVIEKAQESTRIARARIVKKYSKRHDIQHFEVGNIVSLKVPREDRTSTDNRRLFTCILEEPYSHRYKVVTLSGTIKQLIPTKELGAIDKALWPDIVIPEGSKEVTLGLAARYKGCN